MTAKSIAAAMALLCAGLLGCAGGPKYSAVASQLPAVPAGGGRIYFYRDGSPVGSAVQADIKLNNEVVGKSVPGGFFYVDRPAGRCEVSCSTETEKKLTFTLAPAEERYVRTRVSMGLFVGHVSPTLEDKDEAMKTLSGASYTGTPLPSAGGANK